ncbi:MAG TPA: transporter substrate-binding domain-containing protein [Candidatus Aphodovivens excrementavium]|nr:transporter substrate-binding domain-containing protein [Candidatus Aphodovivens excrementavium]
MAAGAVVAAAALLFAAGLASCSDGGSSGGEATNSDGGSTDKTLTVAMELAYPPFETRDEAGDAYGISPAFMQRFTDEYGYDLVIENTAFDGLIPALQTGKADAVMSSITITDEREAEVDFTDPYAVAQLAILANAQSGIGSIDDLNQSDKTVAVKTGSTGDVYATSHLTNATIVRLADESACVTEVVQGRADGFLYDQLTIYRNNQANPDTTTAVFIPFQDPEYWGIAVQSGDDELRTQFNEFIAQCKQDGTFDELTQEFLADEKAAFDDLGFRWFFDFDEEGGSADAGAGTAGDAGAGADGDASAVDAPAEDAA